MSREIALLRAEALPLTTSFDWVLLDVPCSGLGTLRRDPDVRWRRQDGDLPRLAASQLAMLNETARAVRHGGHLVYSTCSSEPEENEDVVRAFVATGKFEPAPLPQTPVIQSLATSAGHLRTFPHRDGLEAFFGAVLRRPSSAD